MVTCSFDVTNNSSSSSAELVANMAAMSLAVKEVHLCATGVIVTRKLELLAIRKLILGLQAMTSTPASSSTVALV